MHIANEDVTFESLRYHVGVLASQKADLPADTGAIITVREGSAIDQLKLATLSIELNNLYIAVYWPTRKFSSEDVQKRQMSDALRWLLGDQPNIVGITATDALSLIGLSAFDLSEVLLEQFERTDAAMSNLYAANVRALLVLDKLGNANAVISTEADALVDTLELRAEVKKPLSTQEAIIMSAADLAHARALLSQQVVQSEGSLDAAYTNLKSRLLAQKELLESHRLTPPSRLQAASAEVQAILLGL